MNIYWISLPCDLLSSLASFQCSLLHHLHLSSDMGLSKNVNQHSHLNLSRNVRLSVLFYLDFNNTCYEYILLYVDDALVVSENAESKLHNELGRYFHLKEESIGPPTVYLGGRVRKVQHENGVWA